MQGVENVAALIADFRYLDLCGIIFRKIEEIGAIRVSSYICWFYVYWQWYNSQVNPVLTGMLFLC